MSLRTTCSLDLAWKHHLLQAYQTGQPLPRSLLHPRWWLDGPAITAVDWQPTYGHEQQLVLSPKGKDIASAAVQLIEGRYTLGPEAQSRLDNTFLQAATTCDRPHRETMPLLNSLLATLTQFPRRFGGRRRLTDLLMLQD